MLSFLCQLLHFLSIIVVVVIIYSLLLYYCSMLQIHNSHSNFHCLVSSKGIYCMFGLGNNHIYAINFSCSKQVLKQLHISFTTLTQTNIQVIKRGGSRLGYFTCYFYPLRSPGKPSLWWTSFITKTREFLTKVTMVGFSIVTRIWGTCVGLCTSTNPTITFWHHCQGGLSHSPQMKYILVNFPQSPYLLNFTWRLL